MEVANTLAYYNMATITTVKCFIIQTPGPNLKKLILAKFMPILASIGMIMTEVVKILELIMQEKSFITKA